MCRVAPCLVVYIGLSSLELDCGCSGDNINVGLHSYMESVRSVLSSGGLMNLSLDCV